MPSIESDRVYLSFAPWAGDAEKRDLARRIESGGLAAAEGLTQQTRSDAIAVVVVCITLVGTGFAQRFGELAADRIIKVIRTAHDWVKERRSTPLQSQPPLVEGTHPAPVPEVIDIVHKESGLTIRLTGTEPDTVLAVLRTLLLNGHDAPDHVLEWDGECWR